jgi:hypothetical protein
MQDAMMTYGGVDVQTHVFFTSALVGVINFMPHALPPGKKPAVPIR